MFSDVVYYHCSEFQIFRPLNSSHFLALSLYPNSVQNQAWFCLHFSDHGKPKQTDVIFSRFVSLSLVNHGRLPRKNWPLVGFSPLLLVLIIVRKRLEKVESLILSLETIFSESLFKISRLWQQLTLLVTRWLTQIYVIFLYKCDTMSLLEVDREYFRW